MEKFKVGVIGGTGMVGQRFVTLMQGHPWFQLTVIAASPRSAGKRYEEAVAGRWAMDVPIPDEAKDMILMSAQDDVEQIASMVDFVFSAVDMKKEEIKALEEAYAKDELARVIIAYEPVWAIGTGRTATAEQANEVCALIRNTIASLYSWDCADDVVIQYGGSMNAGNAAELLAQPDVFGGLIGGASLKPADFAAIVKAACEAAK